MKIVDLNILLYAINRDAPQHAGVLQWWEAALAGDETVAIPWIVVLGFLRISTHPKVFPTPLDVDTALGKVDGWLQHEMVHVVREKKEHWQVVRGLLTECGAAGNLTSDAHLAALAMTHNATLVSCDTDFSRFDGLRLKHPLK